MELIFGLKTLVLSPVSAATLGPSLNLSQLQFPLSLGQNW